jgi:glycosyltransferase involved in cell wall biosynthesis
LGRGAKQGLSMTQQQDLEVCFVGRYNTTELFRGPEKVARRVTDTMMTLGHHVSFYEYYFSGKTYGYWRKLFGKECIKQSERLAVFRVGIFPFMGAMICRQFHVIHIITYERFAIVSFLAKLFHRTPVVFTVHGIVRHQHATFQRAPATIVKIKDCICEFIIMKFTDMQYYFSDDYVSIASRYYSIPRNKIVLIANGIDEEFYLTERKKTDSTSNVSIVFIGEPLRSEKGFDYFLRGLELCSSQAQVFVVCENNQSTDMHLKNGMTVHYLHKMATKDYADFLSDKDIYVGASSCESFSISAVEAMSSGLVPIVTRETGMTRFIEHGKNGFLIHYGDELDLARYVDLLIKNIALRNELSGNARSIYTVLNWKCITEEYLRNYRK